MLQVRLWVLIALCCGLVAVVTVVALVVPVRHLFEDALRESREDQLTVMTGDVAAIVGHYFRRAVEAGRFLEVLYGLSYSRDPVNTVHTLLPEYGESIFALMTQNNQLTSVLVQSTADESRHVGPCDTDVLVIGERYIIHLRPEDANHTADEINCTDYSIPLTCGLTSRSMYIEGPGSLTPLKQTERRLEKSCTSWLGGTAGGWRRQGIPGNISAAEHDITTRYWLPNMIVAGSGSLLKKFVFPLPGPPAFPRSAFGTATIRVHSSANSADLLSGSPQQALERTANASLLPMTLFLVTAHKELFASSVPSQPLTRVDSSGKVTGLLHADNASAVRGDIVFAARMHTDERCIGTGGDFRCSWANMPGVETAGGLMVTTAQVEDSTATLHLLLVALVSTSDIVAPSRDMARKIALVAGCVCVGAFVLAVLFSLLVAHPVAVLMLKLERCTDSLDLSSLESAHYFVSDFTNMQRALVGLVRACVEAGEKVAMYLSIYDIEKADRALRENAKGIPTEMKKALSQLLRNLKEYRPYVPQSVLPRVDDDGNDDDPLDILPMIVSCRSRPSEDPQRRTTTTEDKTDQDRKHAHEQSMATTDRELPTSSGRMHDGRLSFSAVLRRSVSSSGSRDSSRETCVKSKPMPKDRKFKCYAGAAPRTNPVSMLTTNRRGFLESQTFMENETLALWYTREVSAFHMAVVASKGVFDNLSGDRMTATFNASHPCPGHREKAATCAAKVTMLVTPQLDPAAPVSPLATATSSHPPELLPVSAAIVSGKAICGDVGSDAFRRFLVVGGIHNLLWAVERCGTTWGCPVLVDDVVGSDLHTSWVVRLAHAIQHSKRGREEPMKLWEVMAARKDAKVTEEWMYELANREPSPWADYNEAMSDWMAGRFKLAREKALKEQSDGVVGAAMQKIAARIDADDTPVSVVTEFLTTPSPL